MRQEDQNSKPSAHGYGQHSLAMDNIARLCLNIKNKELEMLLRVKALGSISIFSFHSGKKKRLLKP